MVPVHLSTSLYSASPLVSARRRLSAPPFPPHRKMKQAVRLAIASMVGGGLVFLLMSQVLVSSGPGTNHMTRLGGVKGMEVQGSPHRPPITVTMTGSDRDRKPSPPFRPPAASKPAPPPPHPSSSSSHDQASQWLKEKVSHIATPSRPQPPPQQHQQQQQQQQQQQRVEASAGRWGVYPDWWLEAWPRSAVSGSMHQLVGDQPLFPPCTASKTHTKAKVFTFVEPRKYVNISRNPCWYDQPKSQKNLRCVPYLYLAGVAKCGTTDLARRLRKHPQVFTGTKKEYHWWERFRFGSVDDESPELGNIDLTKAVPFREYINDITGPEIEDLQEELKTAGHSERVFGDYSPSYLWDPRHWYSLQGNEGCLEPRIIIAQHILHVYPQAKIILTFRHPTPRLYSRFMSRIHRTPFLKRATVEDFHKYVWQGIKAYRKCFSQWSIRHCAYSLPLYRDVMVRLVEGMYPVFMADWLRVWPRDQIFIMRYEDYGGHEGERLEELVDFLGLDKLTKDQMDKALESEVANSGSVEYQKYGAMLPETKKLLDDFYQPFILQFAEILNDTRFLWKDVYQ